jgi:hypothetical protein
MVEELVARARLVPRVSADDEYTPPLLGEAVVSGIDDSPLDLVAEIG